MTRAGTPPNPLSDEYDEDETARRRDAVIRRMANTPPQPRTTLRPKDAKPTAEGQPPQKRDGHRAKPGGTA